MATVKIASARIDENGKAYGGKAGDQTGKEVSTQNWYLHDKGWYVLRPRRAEVAEIIAKQMEAACKNSKIGYDQHQRHTLYTAAAKVGYDTARVTKATETDCSALVRVCCAAAGITLAADTRTGNMPARMVATGEFVLLTTDMYCKQAAYLRRGDVLVTRKPGHTVVVVSDGELGQAYTASDKCPYSCPTSAFTARAAGAGVLWLQWHLDRLGYDLGRYGIDGDYGKYTKAAVKAFKADCKKRGIKGVTPGNYRIAELTRAALIKAVGDLV